MAGHPIIWHCLSSVARVPVIQEVYIIGYYDESVFRDFIKDSAKEFPSITIRYLREYQALGTAGGLYHFRDAILKGRPDRLFVLNADVCCSFPLAEMLKLSVERDAEAVILGTRVSDDAASNFGCIVSDAHTRRVLHYVEKPESHISNLINCGVYLFSTEAIFPSIRSAIKRRLDRPARLLSYPSSDNLETYNMPAAGAADDDDEEERKNEVIRLEQDILGDMADSKQFYVYETKDFWRQIKTAGSAVPANALYLQKAWQSESDELAKPSANIVPPVFIHPTAQVHPTAKLGPNVSIGPRVTVGAGARIKESIVLEDSEIKHDACVLYSIIGWGSRVGAWARVEGTPTPVNSHSTSIIKNGVKVQSITILGKDCGVGDEVRVQNCVCLPYKELKRVSCLATSKRSLEANVRTTGRRQRGHHVRGFAVVSWSPWHLTSVRRSRSLILRGGGVFGDVVSVSATYSPVWQLVCRRRAKLRLPKSTWRVTNHVLEDTFDGKQKYKSVPYLCKHGAAATGVPLATLLLLRSVLSVRHMRKGELPHRPCHSPCPAPIASTQGEQKGGGNFTDDGECIIQPI